MAISSKLHILVVDDEPNFRQTVKIILTDIGFINIHAAAGAKEALMYIERSLQGGTPVDLVICDYDMPEMNGLDLFIMLEQNVETKKIKYLLTSGYAEQKFVLSAIKSGIRNILLKPFSKQGLVSELAKMLA